jgi:hypothetical protein
MYGFIFDDLAHALLGYSHIYMHDNTAHLLRCCGIKERWLRMLDGSTLNRKVLTSLALHVSWEILEESVVVSSETSTLCL